MMEHGSLGWTKEHMAFVIVSLASGISILYFLLTFRGSGSNAVVYLTHTVVGGMILLAAYVAWRKHGGADNRRKIVTVLAVFVAIGVMLATGRAHWLPQASYFLYPVFLPVFMDWIFRRRDGRDGKDILAATAAACLGSLLLQRVLLAVGYYEFPTRRFALCPALFFLLVTDIVIWDEWKKWKALQGRRMVLSIVLAAYNAVGAGWCLFQNRRYCRILMGLIKGDASTAYWEGYRISAIRSVVLGDFSGLEEAYPHESYWMPLERDTLAAVWYHYGWVPVIALVALLLAVVFLLLGKGRKRMPDDIRYLAVGYVIRMALCVFAALNLLVSEGMAFPFTGVESPEIVFLAIVLHETKYRREVGHGIV